MPNCVDQNSSHQLQHKFGGKEESRFTKKIVLTEHCETLMLLPKKGRGGFGYTSSYKAVKERESFTS